MFIPLLKDDANCPGTAKEPASSDFTYVKRIKSGGAISSE
jgi:hypothetical protein